MSATAASDPSPVRWPYQSRQVAKLDSAMKIKEDRNGSNDQKEVHR